MANLKSIDIKIASKIASKFLDSKNISIKSVGAGSNNKNFLVESKDSRQIVVKLSHAHKEYKAFEDYIKEKWCIERSSEAGVPGHKVFTLGKFEGRAYMIENFVSGKNGNLVQNKAHIWHELGRYTKLIHSIKVSGFGENLIDTKRGLFEGSWQKYLNYNIKSLTDDDKLTTLKVLTKYQSKKVKSLFQNIRKQKFTFGLNHGDISIWNTLVEKSGKVNLLDWGSAEVHIIPHFDFIHVVRCQLETGRPNEGQLQTFIKGYGMSQKEFKFLKPQLLKLMLLISFDKLRWAIDRNPPKVKEFTKRAKRMLKLNIDNYKVQCPNCTG